MTPTQPSPSVGRLDHKCSLSHVPLPEVDESDDVDECEGDADEDEEAAAEVGEEEQRDDDDRQEGQPDVAAELVPDHLVSLPLGVHLSMACVRSQVG